MCTTATRKLRTGRRQVWLRHRPLCSDCLRGEDTALCVSTAFVAKTLPFVFPLPSWPRHCPLPYVPTAFMANTLPFALRFRRRCVFV